MDKLIEREFADLSRDLFGVPTVYTGPDLADILTEESNTSLRPR